MPNGRPSFVPNFILLSIFKKNIMSLVQTSNKIWRFAQSCDAEQKSYKNTCLKESATSIESSHEPISTTTPARLRVCSWRRKCFCPRAANNQHADAFPGNHDVFFPCNWFKQATSLPGDIIIFAEIKKSSIDNFTDYHARHNQFFYKSCVIYILT